MKGIKNICRFVSVALLASVVVFIFTACANPAELMSIRDLFSRTLEQMQAPTSENLSIFPDSATIQKLDEYGIDPVEFESHVFSNLSWTVDDIKIEGDKAHVTLTVTNVSLSVALDNAAKQFQTFSSSAGAQELFDAEGESGLFSKLFEYLYSSLDAQTENPVSQTVTVLCEKSDDTWHIAASGNDEFLHALYGGSNLGANLSFN